jgi:hypothetical protein
VSSILERTQGNGMSEGKGIVGDWNPRVQSRRFGPENVSEPEVQFKEVEFALWLYN